MKEPVSARELRAAFREALAAEGRASEDLPDEMQLSVSLGPETSVEIDLTRLFTELQRADPEDRAQRFKDFVAATLEAIRGAEGTADAPARDQLVPVLKGKHWVAGLPQHDLAIESLVGDLCVVYAFDQPHSFAFASRDELAKLGIASAADARELALDNLRDRLPEELETRGDGQSFMFTIGGNFEASLLLLPELWDQMEVDGDIVACVLARDICLFTGTETPGGVDSLVAARARILESMPPHDLISTALLVRRGGAWELFRAA